MAKWSKLHELHELWELKQYWKKYPNSGDTFFAFKYVSSQDKGSPTQDNHRIIYSPGKIITVKSYDTDEKVDCGKGINVATLMWCLHNAGDIYFEKAKSGYIFDRRFQLVKLECKVQDIVAIPLKTDGKFRVKKAKVLNML